MNIVRGSLFLVLGLSAASFPVAWSSQSEPVDEQSLEVSARIEAMGNDEYRVREEAYQWLESQGSSARQALEEAADHEDPEIRWRVARLLDRLSDQSPQSGLKPIEEEPPGSLEEAGRSLRDFRSLDELQQEMQRMIEELDRSLDDDELRGFYRGRPFHMKFFDDPFGILDEVMERTPWNGSKLTPGSHFSRTEIVDGEKRTLTVTVEADGHVHAEERVGEEVREYEAGSWEEFLEAYPDLAADLNSPTNLRMPVPLPSLRPFMPNELVTENPATKPRLGVSIDQVDPVLQNYLALEPGLGLYVKEVLPEYPAERMGIQPNDIIVAVNGQAIYGVEDVHAAMDNEVMPLQIEVLRRGHSMILADR